MQRFFRGNGIRTKYDVEVDLIVERPNEKILFIEIKSTTSVRAEQISSFSKLAEDFGECEAICFSQDIRRKNLKNIQVFP